MKRVVLILGLIYLAGIHGALVYVLVKNRELNPMVSYIDLSHHYYKQRLETAPGPGLVFIGDSMTSMLCVESRFKAINLGIHGDTAQRLSRFIGNYPNLHGKTIVLEIGANDVPRPTEKITDDVRSILKALPFSRVLVSSVPPLDEDVYYRHYGVRKTNAQINALNESLAKLRCPNAVFCDTTRYLKDSTGRLNPSLHVGDGIHLNPKGYEAWVRGL
jgi:hypothetical protein